MLRIPNLFHLLAASLSCLSVFISFVYPLHLPPWRTFAAEWFFALFVFLGLIGLIIKNPHLVVRVNPIFLVLFVLTVVLGFVLSSHHTEVVWWIIYATLAWFAYMLGVNQENTDLNAPIIIVILAITLTSLFSLIQRYGVLQIPESLKFFIYIEKDAIRAFTSIGQPNRFGVLAVISAFLSLWVFLRTQSTPHRIFLMICLMILVQGIVLSQSRVALIGLVLASSLLLMTTAARVQKPKVSDWLLPLAPLIIFLISIPLHSLLLGLESRTVPLTQETSYSDPQRIRMWLLGLKALSDSPWLGHGMGSIPSLALDNAPVFGSFEYLILTHLHNTPLDFMVEQGVLLGSTIVAFFYFFWIKSIKNSVGSDKAFIACATLPLFIHSLLEYPLYYGYFLWLLFWLLGFLNSRKNERFTSTVQLSPAASLIILSIAMIGALSSIRSYLQVERMFSLASVNRMEEVRTSSAQPTMLQTVLFGHLVKRISWLTTEVGPDSRMTPEQIADLEAAARAYPQYLLVWRSAVANAANGQPDRAAWWAERLCHMFEPESCRAAKELWESVERPGWPRLNWEHWLEPSSPRPGQGMVRSR